MLGFATVSINSKGKSPEPKDTVKAIITYGNDFLFETAVNFSSFSIQEGVDLLIGLDTILPHQLDELNFYTSVAKKTETESFIEWIRFLNEILYLIR